MQPTLHLFMHGALILVLTWSPNCGTYQDSYIQLSHPSRTQNQDPPCRHTILQAHLGLALDLNQCFGNTINCIATQSSAFAVDIHCLCALFPLLQTVDE